MKCKWAVLASPVLAAALLCGCVPVQVMGSMMDLGSFVVSVQQILEEGTVEDLPAESRSSVSMERLTYTAGGSISNVEVEEKDASVQLRTGPVDRVTVEYSQPAGSQLYTFAERGGTLIVKKERETKGSRHSEEQPTVITLPDIDQSFDVYAILSVSDMGDVEECYRTFPGGTSIVASELSTSDQTGAVYEDNYVICSNWTDDLTGETFGFRVVSN